jgi:polygalacturonase
VRVSNCSVNSPWDDGICLKSSFGLGYARPTEDVTMVNCFVSGSFLEGALLDGTYKKFPDDTKVRRNGRIKFGTESNGGFRNITISNCVFDGCRGLALETVDGGLLEDVAMTNITMRDVIRGSILIRLGARMRGPAGVPVGSIRRVTISNIVSSNAESPICASITGIPGNAIEDLRISNIYIQHRGGGSAQDAGKEVPEVEDKYPEPDMFGPTLPAHGFYIRHVNALEMGDIKIVPIAPDARRAFVLDNVNGADFFRIKVPQPAFELTNVTDFANIP